MTSIHQFKVEGIDGSEIDFAALPYGALLAGTILHSVEMLRSSDRRQFFPKCEAALATDRLWFRFLKGSDRVLAIESQFDEFRVGRGVIGARVE